MPDPQSNAEMLVRSAISPRAGHSHGDRQDLPTLDLVGAAIARAARLAAAEDRAQRVHSLYAPVQHSQAAQLLRAARDARDARDANGVRPARAAHTANTASPVRDPLPTHPAPASDSARPPHVGASLSASHAREELPEGRVLPQTGRTPGFLWRFHPAPDAGPAFPAVFQPIRPFVPECVDSTRSPICSPSSTRSFTSSCTSSRAAASDAPSTPAAAGAPIASNGITNGVRA
jgi:hypothetical protein